MREQRIKFLADESCDFTVVRMLRSADYDVVAVAESLPSTPDVEVLLPANMRSELGNAVGSLVAEHGPNLVKSFTVLEPGRARIRKQK